jgi:hypothetical protein
MLKGRFASYESYMQALTMGISTQEEYDFVKESLSEGGGSPVHKDMARKG